MGFEIRQLSEAEFEQAHEVFCQAYPSFKSQGAAQREESVKANRSLHASEPLKFYGVWLDNELSGAFIMFDFEMNFRGRLAPMGGIGAVAVSMLRKKRHVARELIKFYIEENRKRGALFTGLYPFRPDFYKKMGYSYGFNLFEYRFSPERLINDSSTDGVKLLDKTAPETAGLLHGCYVRHLRHTHGAVSKSMRWWKRLINDDKAWVAGVYEGDTLKSYMSFRLEDLKNGISDGTDLCVGEIIGADREIWKKYRSFLAVQSDQFRSINLQTPDVGFHYNFRDPRTHDNSSGYNWKFNCGRQVLGMMLRVCDPEKCWQQTDGIRFGNYDGVLGFRVQDSLFEKEYAFAVEFKNGQAQLSDKPPVFTVSAGIGEFSALLMNSADAGSLYEYGAIEADSEAAGKILKQIFNNCDNPHNTVFF